MTIKKILYVHHTTALGGATNSLLYNIQNLPADKYSAEVLFLEREGVASEIFKKNGIKIHHIEGIVNYQHADNAIIKWISRKPLQPLLQFFKMLDSVPKLEAYLADKSYDIIHINTSVMLPVGIAAKRKGLKVVWHVREPIAKGVLGLRRWLVRRIINKNADKIIAISKQDAQSLGKSDKIEVVYNFVDFKKFNKDMNSATLLNELGMPQNTRFITMLGGVVHSKGADLFIKAIPEVITKNPDAMFIIAGYPPNYFGVTSTKNSLVRLIKLLFRKKDLSKECLKLIKKFNVQNKVKFIGLRQDIPQILASSKLLVWPASIPHFARPIIEAQAMGVPAVACNFKSSAEIIADKRTGLLFNPGDHNDLADKINLLLENTEMYDAISKEGYQQATKLFNSEINFKKILTIYNSL